MPTVERSLIIHVARASLFELTQDYGRRLRWDCFLKEAMLLDGATNAAVGVRAWCVAWHGLGMETEYVTVKPPAVAAVRMNCADRCSGGFAGTWRFMEDEPDATRVVFRYHFKARPWWLAWLIDPMLGVLFGGTHGCALDALKRAAESAH